MSKEIYTADRGSFVLCEAVATVKALAYRAEELENTTGDLRSELHKLALVLEAAQKGEGS